MRWMLLALALVGCGGETADDLTVSPSPYDFGAVTVGQSVEATFTVWNPSTETKPLGMTIAPMGPDMLPRLESCGVTLTAGETCTIVVRFAPQSVGSLTGLLTVRPGVTVPLSGLAR